MTVSDDLGIRPGDRVLDKLDGKWRVVAAVLGQDVHFEDGGAMGLVEAVTSEHRLPHEALA